LHSAASPAISTASWIATSLQPSSRAAWMRRGIWARSTTPVELLTVRTIDPNAMKAEKLK
jgi:hypothetical protein